MLKRLIFATALAAGLASPASAQVVPQVIATCGVGVSLPLGPGGRLYQDQTGILCTTAGSGGGGGGGGATGSVTAPGTSGSVAQAVQGITGGVPLAITGSFLLDSTFTGRINTLGQKTSAQSTPVVLPSDQSLTIAATTGSMEQDTRSTTGTLNAASTSSTLDIPINGQATVGLRFSGLAASGATVSYFQSMDGGTTFTPVAENNTGTGTLNLTRTTDGQVRVSAAGRTTIRLQVTTAGTGTISVAYNTSVRAFGTSIDAPLPPGANALGSVLSDLRVAGAAVTSANPVPVTVVSGGGSGGGNAATTSNATDGQATSTTNQQNVTYGYIFNGTTWDRQRGTGGATNVSIINGGVYNSTAPTLTNGQQAPFQFDQNGNLKTTGGGAGGGSGPYYVAQYNSTLPTFASGQSGYLALDSNGRVLLAPTSSVSVSNFPASQAVTNAGTFAVQNTAATPAGTNSIGTVGLNAGTNTVGTVNLGTLNGAATAANQATMIANQNATTGSATGGTAGTSSTLGGGIYNTTPPTLANGQQAAQQFDINGNQKTVVQQIGPTLGTAAVGTMAQDGNPAAGSPFTFSALTTQTGFRTAGYNSASIELVGTGTMTIQVETSSDSTNGTDGTWTSVSGSVPNDNGAQNGFATLSGGRLRMVFPTNAAPWMRLRTTAYTTGTFTAYVTLRAAPYVTHDVYVGAGTITLTNGSGSIGGISSVAASGGINSFSRLTSSAANTNLTQAKGAAGRVYKVVACNTSTTSARIKFYNALSANVTVGTTSPLFTRPIPAAAAAGGLACASYDWSDIGTYFSTGISWAITTGAADTDTTAVAAGAITDVSVEYQ